MRGMRRTDGAAVLVVGTLFLVVQLHSPAGSVEQGTKCMKYALCRAEQARAYASCTR
jgi:hypothetical protein